MGLTGSLKNILKSKILHLSVALLYFILFYICSSTSFAHYMLVRNYGEKIIEKMLVKFRRKETISTFFPPYFVYDENFIFWVRSADS